VRDPQDDIRTRGASEQIKEIPCGEFVIAKGSEGRFPGPLEPSRYTPETGGVPRYHRPGQERPYTTFVTS
jgi:hypothetical protein